MKKVTKQSGKERMIFEDEEEEEKEEEGEKRGAGLQGKSEDDGWEGEDEIEVDTLVQYQQKADINWWPPQPSKKIRAIPCLKCKRLGRDCLEQKQGTTCWLCARTKSKYEPGEKAKGKGNAAGTRRPAPPKKAPAPSKKVKPSQSQCDWAKTKDGPS